MAQVVEQQQNVVVRLINLPLVSSTYDMVSSAYVNTKENHPYLKSVCGVAEKSMKTITSVAMTSAKPILEKLEPQIAMANNIASVGLDKIEEKLPILHQPSEKVVDMTKAVVNGSINTVLGSSGVKIMSSGVDTALTTSETLLEQYLPPTDELTKEEDKTEGFKLSKDKPSCYVRLASLSTKVCKRACQQVLGKQVLTRIKAVKSRSQEATAQLQNTDNLVPAVSINDLGSKTDGNPDLLEDEELQDLSRIIERK